MNPKAKKPKLNQRGVALLLVVAAICLLTGMVVEFMNNTRVNANHAYSQKERAQAYYMAQSAIQFARLVIALDKEVRKMAASASKKLGKDVIIPPLYESVPINSALMRQMTGAATGSDAEGEGGEAPSGDKTESAPSVDLEKSGEEGGGTESQASEAFGLISSQGAADFLSFEGDFIAEVEEEDSKINLNAFFTLSPTQKEYERLKMVIYHLLLTDEFSGMFEDKFRGAKQLAQNIADYIDRDDAVHENGEERGREGAGGGVGSSQGTMKNGKLLTVEELAMVPGMTEQIFQKLKPYVTVYGKDEKINICRAAEPVVDAMILGYTENNTKMEPMRDDNKDLLTQARDAVINGCPDADSMASELDSVLGVEKETSESDASGAESGPTSVKTGNTTQKTGTGQSSSNSFSSMVKNDANIFRITGIGTVGETEVRLKIVLDTSGGSAKTWKELYWRVE